MGELQMMNRREMATGMAMAILTSSLMKTSLARADAPFLADELSKIESGSGGRLGVAILDTATLRHAEHRAAERFPMCSTFKFLLAAAVLKRAENGQEELNRRIKFQASDLETY